MENWLRFVAEQRSRGSLSSRGADSSAGENHTTDRPALSYASLPTNSANEGSMPSYQTASLSSDSAGALIASSLQGGLSVYDQQAARILANSQHSSLSSLPISTSAGGTLVPQDQLILELIRRQPQPTDQLLSLLQAYQIEATLANLQQEVLRRLVNNNVVSAERNRVTDLIQLATAPPLLGPYASLPRGLHQSGKNVGPHEAAAAAAAAAAVARTSVGGNETEGKHTDERKPAGKKRKVDSAPVFMATNKKVRQESSATTFPEKLYQLLSESEASGNTGIVSFTERAPGFRIHKLAMFEAEIAPRYFSPWDMKCFRQQLQLHSFARSSDELQDSECYRHPYFSRGRSDLLHNVVIQDSTQHQKEARLVPQGPSSQHVRFPMRGRTHHGHEPFPEKLFRMLNESEEAGLGSIISFTESGNSFRIHNADAFVDRIVPKYFRHHKLDSFRRQLNLYGFARVFRGSEKGAYFHEYFKKSRPDLLHRIRHVPKESVE